MSSSRVDRDFLEILQTAPEVASNAAGYRTVRVAILSDTSPQYLTEVLSACLHDRKLHAEIYAAQGGSIDQEALDPSSELYRFSPDFVWLRTSSRPLLSSWYSRGGAQPEPIEDFLGRIVARWDAVSSRCGARVVQDLLECPSDRLFGSSSGKAPGSLDLAIRKLNVEILEKARPRGNVFVNDVEYALSYYGRREWEDLRYWYGARLACSPSFLPAVARGVADVVASCMGLTRKCVVVDLDNVVWGGAIADDGLEGIRLGGLGEGECFLDIQRFLRALRERGILLAACSKNFRADAALPFERHPEMVLKLEDFSAFVANWEPKSRNVAEIARQLGLSLDSLVFLDDSPYEREEVRQACPDVCVPELPEDPSDIVPFLNNLNPFETTSFSEEDGARARRYREEADREVSKASFTDLSGFLRSLEMRATFSRFDRENLPRIVQLIERSNQFNLTTSRLDGRRCEAVAADRENFVPCFVRLSDRFGDYGLVSALVMRRSGDSLAIDEWVMSCRALGRGLERYCIDKAVEEAARLGVGTIEGTFKATSRNELVRELYGELGFRKIAASRDGETRWALDVASYRPSGSFIHDASAGGG